MQHDQDNKSAEIGEYVQEEYLKWLKSQEGQTSAYDYKKNYVEFMQKVGHHILSKTTESTEKSRNSKKSPNEPGRNRSK